MWEQCYNLRLLKIIHVWQPWMYAVWMYMLPLLAIMPADARCIFGFTIFKCSFCNGVSDLVTSLKPRNATPLSVPHFCFNECNCHRPSRSSSVLLYSIVNVPGIRHDLTCHRRTQSWAVLFYSFVNVCGTLALMTPLAGNRVHGTDDFFFLCFTTFPVLVQAGF